MVSTRTLVVLAGLALLVLGGALAVGSVVVQMAWALPVADVIFHPTVVEGEALAGLGVGLLVLARYHLAGDPAAASVPVHDTPLRLAS